MSIGVQYLKERLHYHPEIGIFTWKPIQEHDKYLRTWNKRFAGKVAGCNAHGYCLISIDYKRYYAHRLAWLYVHGHWPDYEIDHINHHRSDNRLFNLRAVSRAHNTKNRSFRKDNSSGITGVFWRKDIGKWQACIGINRKQYMLGVFDNLEGAIAVRKAAERKHGFHNNHGRSV